MSYNNHQNQKYHPYSFRPDQYRHGYYRINQVPILNLQPPTTKTTIPPPQIPGIRNMLQTTIPQAQAQAHLLAPIPQPQVYYQPYPPQQYYTYVQPQGESSLPSNKPRKTKHFSTWTPAEDKLLRELKEEQKMGWKQILTYLNDRTPNACQFRWRRVVGSINVSNTSVATLPPSSPAASSSRSHSLTHIDTPSSSMTSPKQPNPSIAESAESESREHMQIADTTPDTSNSSHITERRKSSHHSINFLLN